MKAEELPANLADVISSVAPAKIITKPVAPTFVQYEPPKYTKELWRFAWYGPTAAELTKDKADFEQMQKDKQTAYETQLREYLEAHPEEQEPMDSIPATVVPTTTTTTASEVCSSNNACNEPAAVAEEVAQAETRKRSRSRSR